MIQALEHIKITLIVANIPIFEYLNFRKEIYRFI